MKALVLSTAIAFAFAAPSFANDQLAQGLGVDANQYTTAQLIGLQRALDDDNYRLADHIRSGGGSVTGVAPGAAAIIADLIREDDTAGPRRFSQGSGTEVISTQSFGGGVTDAGRAFAIEQAREADDWRLVRTLEAGGSLNGVRSLY